MSATLLQSADPGLMDNAGDLGFTLAAPQWMSLSAADEQTRYANSNWGPSSVVQTIQTHSDELTHADVPDGSPDPGRAQPTRSFAAPTAHGRAHLHVHEHTRSSDSRRSARRAPLLRTIANCSASIRGNLSMSVCCGGEKLF